MPTANEVERLKRVYQGYQEQSYTNLWSAENLGNQWIVRERMKDLQELLHQAHLLPLVEQRILDIGCGTGKVLSSLLAWGAKPELLYGVDLLPERIELAQQTYPDLHFQTSNAEQLPFDSAFFDMVMFFTVFSSILNPHMAQNVANEANRVLKPGGAIIWYDFRYRNPQNPNTQPMRIYDIQHLFPGFAYRLRTTTLLPPLVRRFKKLTPFLYPIIGALPFLRTHYVGLLIKQPTI